MPDALSLTLTSPMICSSYSIVDKISGKIGTKIKAIAIPLRRNPGNKSQK